jgi:hypothetical protein
MAYETKTAAAILADASYRDQPALHATDMESAAKEIVEAIADVAERAHFTVERSDANTGEIFITLQGSHAKAGLRATAEGIIFAPKVQTAEDAQMAAEIVAEAKTKRTGKAPPPDEYPLPLRYDPASGEWVVARQSGQQVDVLALIARVLVNALEAP